MDENQLAQQAVDKGYVSSVEEYKQAEAIGKQQAGAIPAQDITATEPVVVPTPTATEPTQIIEQIANETQKEVERTQKEAELSRQNLQSNIKKAVGIMESRDKLEQEAGIGEARLDVANIQSQIEGRQLALRRAIEETAKTPGLSGTQIARRTMALNRDAAREMADLAIIENSRLRRLDALETNLDRKMTAMLAPLQFQLQYDQMFYQENRAAMTSAQDRAFQVKLAQDQRQYEQEKEKRDSIKQIALQAAQYGASGEQVKAISDARNPLEAILASGDILSRPFQMQQEEFALQKRVAEANIANVYSQINERRNAALLAQLTESIAAENEKEAQTESQLGIQSLLNEVANHSGKSAAVGAGFKKTLGMLPFVSPDAIEGSARAGFEAQAKRLSDMFLVENLDKMKGVLTDKDIEVLRNEGTTIGNFSQSEADWNKEWDRLNAMIERGLLKNGVTPEQASFYYGVEADEIAEINSIFGNTQSTQAFDPKIFYQPK